MKNSVLTLSNYFFSRKFTLLIILYLVLGCFFVSFEFANRDYFDIFIATLTSEKFTTIFLFPSFLAMYYNLFLYLDNWNEVVLRTKTRKNYVKYHFKFILKATIYFFVIVLLILGIFCNFMPKSGYSLTMYSQYQNVPAFILIVLSMLKIFFSLFILGLINLIFSLRCRNQMISVIVGIFYILILQFSRVFYTPSVLAAILSPGFHAFGVELTNNIIYCLITDFLYFMVIIILCYFIALRVGKKCNIGINIRK